MHQDAQKLISTTCPVWSANRQGAAATPGRAKSVRLRSGAGRVATGTPPTPARLPRLQTNSANNATTPRPTRSAARRGAQGLVAERTSVDKDSSGARPAQARSAIYPKDIQATATVGRF